MSTRTLTGQMPHRCQFCDKLFNFPYELNDHVKSHTGDKPYKGMLSEDSFVYVKYKWSSRKRTCAGDKPDKCQLTENSFAYKEYHWNHKRTDSGRLTGENPFEFECEKYLAHIDKLKGCIRTSNDEKPYKCQLCEKSFAQNGSLKKHMLTHTREKLYKCQFCEKSFAQNGNLQSHILTHTGEKPYKCQFCEISFTQNGSLKQHMLTHTGEKPYKCQLCEKSFAQNDSLKKHMLTHTGEKPYKCQFCEKSFAHNGNLQVHKLTHIGEKPYKCQFCEKSFAQNVHLQSHILTHTGEKPYKCPLCQKSFTHNRYLKHHIIIHLGEVDHKTLNNLLRNLESHRGIRTIEKTYVRKEPPTETSALTKQFQFHSGVNPLELKLEKGVIANVSNVGFSFSTSKTTDERNETSSKNICNASNEVTDQLKLNGIGECLSINRVELSEDAKLFYEKSYGCGICDEILEMKEDFLEHCSGHGLTSSDELVLGLFR